MLDEEGERGREEVNGTQECIKIGGAVGRWRV